MRNKKKLYVAVKSGKGGRESLDSKIEKKKCRMTIWAFMVERRMGGGTVVK